MASGGAARVPVMKTAETRKREDLAHLGRLDWPVVRGVLREGDMNAILVVPGLELSEQPPRVSFTDHEYVVEELAADGPDEALGVAVRSLRADGGLVGPNAQTPDLTGELLSICSVAVPDQELGSGVPGEGVDDLLPEPGRRWVRRHVREHKAPALEGQNDEDVEDLEPDRRHCKHVDRDDALGLVAKEGTPGLRTGPSGLRPDLFEVSRDRPFADVEAQLEQLAVDSRCTPGRILRRHLADEPPGFSPSSWAAALRLPPPEETEPPPMPGDDRLGPDDDQVLTPPAEAVNDERPEGSATRSQVKPGWLRAEEDTELMAEGEVLGDEGRPGTEKIAEGAESESNQAEHRNRIRLEGEASRRLLD